MYTVYMELKSQNLAVYAAVCLSSISTLSRVQPGDELLGRNMLLNIIE